MQHRFCALLYCIAALVAGWGMTLSPFAATITWDAGGAANLGWNYQSSGGVYDNWSDDGSPAGDAIVFGNTGTAASGTTNTVDADTTIGALTYANYGASVVHTTQINSGVTLSASGAFTVGQNVAGTSPTTVYIKGATAGVGTLTVNTASNVTIGTYWDWNGRPLTLDMSGLGTFNATAATVSVGYVGGNGGAVTWKLAGSNTLTANTLRIAYWSQPHYLYLGQTNALNVNLIGVGYESNASVGTMAFAAGLTNPTVTIRSRDGVGRANLTLGDGTQGTNGDCLGTLDFGTTGSVDALLGTVILGVGQGGAQSAGGTGTLTVNNGTIDATSMLLGHSIGANTSAGRGNLNIGGTAAVTVGALTLADRDNTGSATGVVTLSGGTLRATTIQKGDGTGTRTFNFNSGTIGNKSGTDLTITADIPLTLLTAATHAFDVENGRTATVSSAISGLAGTGGIAKSGLGTLVLNAANSYTGGTTVSAGTLTVAANGGLGTGNAAVNAATLRIGTGGTTGDIAGNVALGGGALVFDRSSDLTYAGSVTGTGSLAKNSAGALTLTGAASWTGPTTVNAGALLLDHTANNSAKLGGGGLTLGGAALTLSGSSAAPSAESATGLTLNAGASRVTVTSGTGQSATLALGGITRGGYATLDITLPASGAVTTTTANSAGILGGYATVGGAGWAAATGAGPTYTIAALAAYSTNDFTAATNNVDATANQAPAAGPTVNSLRFNTPAAATVTNTGALTVNSGGVLVTPNVGSSAAAIVGGSLTSGNGQDLIVLQNNTGNAFTIGAAITNNGATPITLTKAGAGTLVLTGANSYTGGTCVGAGTLRGAVASFPGTITNYSTVVFDQPTNATYSTPIGGTGAVTKTGAGTLTLNASNSYSGATTVQQGTLELDYGTNTASKISTTAPLNLAGGTLKMTNATTTSVTQTTGGLALQPGASSLLMNGTLLSSQPNTVSGLTLWLDATDAATITKDGSNAVSQWNDKSGGGFNFTQGNASYKPTYSAAGGSNGTATVQFNRTSRTDVDFMDFSLGSASNLKTAVNNGNTMFAVAKANALAGNYDGTESVQAIVEIQGYHSGLEFGGTAALTLNRDQWLNNNATNMSSTLNATVGQWYVIGATAAPGSPSTATVSGNGVAGTAASNAATTFTQYSSKVRLGIANDPGSSYIWPLAGGISEVLIYNRVLTASELNAVGSYLASKYVIGTTYPAASSMALSVGPISRAAGGTLNLTLPAGGGVVKTSTGNSAYGLLGGFATLNAADFAYVAADGSLRACTAYTAQDSAGAWAAGQNLTNAAGYSGTVASNLTIGSLRFNAAASSSVTVGAGVTLTVGTGGILETAAVGASPSSITGGSLTSGNGQDLVVHQYDTTSALTIASAITDNGATPIAVTKSGPGALVLTGANSYTGGTFLNDGTLQGSATSLRGNIATTAGTTLTLDQATDGVPGGLITGGGSLVKSGVGKLTLGAGNAYTGTTSITGGTLAVNGTTSGQGSYAVTASAVGGAALGGSGTIGLTAGNSATLTGYDATRRAAIAPGNSIGTLSVTGNVTFGDYTSMVSEVGLPGQSDLLAITGNLNLSSALDQLEITTSSPLAGEYVLASWTGAVSGVFNQVVVNGVPVAGDGTAAGAVGGNYWLEYRATGSGILVLVPEPSALALLAAAAGLLLRRRRA